MSQEQQIEHATALAEVRTEMRALRETQGEIRLDVRDIADAVKSLAVVEEKQAATSTAVERAFKLYEGHEQRIRALEVAMPGVIELRKWLVKGMLGILAAVGVAVLALIGLRPWER